MNQISKNLRSDSEELTHIDMVRFFSSCCVVLLHVRNFMSINDFFFFIMKNGKTLSVSVDVFFVISGFIISYMYSEKMGSPRQYGEFLKKRVARLVPLHWATLTFMLVLAIIIKSAHLPMRTISNFDFACLPTEVLLLNAEGLCGHMSFNGPSWSIGAESIMYVLFPIFLIIVRFSSVLTTIAIAAFLWMIISDGKITGTYDFGVIRAVPSFAFGMLLFRVRDLVRLLPAPTYVLAAAMAAYLFSIFYGLPIAFVLLSGYVIAIAAIASDLSGHRASFLVKNLGVAGQLTYSIYMLQGPFMFVFVNIIGNKILHLHGTINNLYILCMFVILGLVSRLSFQYFETPVRRWIGRLGTSPRPRQPAPIIAASEPVIPAVAEGESKVG